MNSNYNRFAEFPRTHETITPSANLLAKGPAMIYAGTSGNLVVEDTNGTQITYAVQAGDILPVLVRKVLAATTVTQVIALR